MLKSNQVGPILFHTFQTPKLSLRRPKYLNTVNIIKCPGPWPERIKQLKIIRKVQINEFYPKLSEAKKALLHQHFKTLQQITDYFRVITLRAITCAKAVKEFYFPGVCSKSCRSLLTKRSIRVLVLDATRRIRSKDEPDLFERNFRRIRRQIVRFKELKLIKLTLHDINRPRSVRYLKLMEELASLISPQVRISLSLTLGRLDENMPIRELETLGNISKRICSITGEATNLASLYFTKHITEFSQLQSLRISLNVDQNTDLEYLQSLYLLNSLTCLEISLCYDSRQSDAIVNFHKYFSVPPKLQIFGLELSSQNLETGDLVHIKYPPNCEALLQNFFRRITNIPELQELKFEFFIDLEDPHLKILYPLINTLLKNKPKLRTINLQISEERMNYITEIPYMNVTEFFSSLESSLASLRELDLLASGFSFEDFNQVVNLNNKLNLNRLSITGQIRCIEGFDSFMRLVKPAKYTDSQLEFGTWKVKTDDIDSLFRTLTTGLTMESVYLTIVTQASDNDKAVEKIFSLLKKIKGPKMVELSFPSINPKDDDEEVILETLNGSIGKVNRFVIEFGKQWLGTASRFVFVRNGRHYQLESEE